MCRKQEERLHYLFIIINSDVGLFICRELLCIVLQLIIIIFGSRTEMVIVLRENKDGNVHNSCAYTFSGFPLAVSAQGTYFYTDDYDSRIYASEKGLLYTFYTPSYYGKGFRYSAHVRYDMNKTFMFLVKFGQTVYRNRKTIGSGNDLIEGNKKTDLQMQFRIKF